MEHIFVNHQANTSAPNELRPAISKNLEGPIMFEMAGRVHFYIHLTELLNCTALLCSLAEILCYL